ncbi:hypothetical protein LTS18_009856 [Coniosporium uncinatum]|uniref:Uncharacterized protein n=1 Tax=Coniosporium uncinatum TaxID=93489 RepID=A0ACC3D9X1_9PEZI|nr:hypothetical protein LTS18_009856 [Coniosporium uncinatum]
MRQRGHKYQIDRESDGEYPICDPDIEISSSRHEIEVKKKRSSEPQKKTRKQAVQWVIQTMQRSRGRELPGTFNPMLIDHLFWDQSEPWETLVQEHINPVARASALDEFKHTVKDTKRHPITYNDYFSDTLQKRQQERSSNSISRSTQEATVSVTHKTFTGGSGYEQKNFSDPGLLQQALNRTTEKDMDKFPAEQALDAHDAYYKQAIERHLIAGPTEILSPTVAAPYSDKEVCFIAAGSSGVVQMREHLQSKKKMSEAGQEAFRNAVG